MKWDEPISKPNSVVKVHLQTIAGSGFVVQFNQPYMPDKIPSHFEFVSQLLDARVQIDDAGIGRRIYEGTLMDLALQRLRASGLVPAPGAAPIGDAPDFISGVPESADEAQES